MTINLQKQNKPNYFHNQKELTTSDIVTQIADKYDFYCYDRGNNTFQINGNFVIFELDLNNGINDYSYCFNNYIPDYQDTKMKIESFLNEIRTTFGAILTW